jgi:hypothetical protein
LTKWVETCLTHWGIQFRLYDNSNFLQLWVSRDNLCDGIPSIHMALIHFLHQFRAVVRRMHTGIIALVHYIHLVRLVHLVHMAHLAHLVLVKGLIQTF